MRIKKVTKYPIQVRLAAESDLDSITAIARQYSSELGFVMRVALIESIQRGNLLVADYEDNSCVGFVNYRSRKDGWNTIYEVAVNKKYRGKGIGRFLVDAVPCPTRLKCVVDNTANEFYKKSHFKLVKTEQGRKRQLNVWERNVLYVFCKGSSKSTLEVVKELDVTYGTRHTENPYIQPYFVDIKWEKYDWLEYLMKLRLWKPVFALVPDFTALDQKEFIVQAVEDVKASGVLRVGVCPKFDGAVQYIPDECVVCVSLPSRYAGFLPDPKELHGRKLHLLGGSPIKQFKYIKEHPDLLVISTDTNAHTQAARFHAVYDWDGETIKRKGDVDYLSYVERISYSTEHIYKSFT